MVKDIKKNRICLTAEIDFGVPCEIPIHGAIHQNNFVLDNGQTIATLKLERDRLYLDDREIVLFVASRQNKSMSGNNLQQELSNLGRNVGARMLDYLICNPHFWPNRWKPVKGKRLYVFFFGDSFVCREGKVLIRCGQWVHDKVIKGYSAISENWSSTRPSACFSK